MLALYFKYNMAKPLIETRLLFVFDLFFYFLMQYLKLQVHNAGAGDWTLFRDGCSEVG